MNHKIIKTEELLKSSRWNLKVWLNSNQEDLSTSFPMIKLGELLVERKKSLNPQDFKDSIFNYVGLENVKSYAGFLVEFAPKYGKSIKSRSKIFVNGDILYGRLRPSLNKCMLVDDRLKEGICSTEFFVLVRKNEQTLPNYLRYILTSDFVLKKVKILTSGAALPRIQIKDFLGIEIPVPPIEVQKQYDAFIREAFEKHFNLYNSLKRFPSLMNQSFNEAVSSGSIPSLELNNNQKTDSWDNPLPMKKESVLSGGTKSHFYNMTKPLTLKGFIHF